MGRITKAYVVRQKFNYTILDCPEYGVRGRGSAPSTGLCRKLVERGVTGMLEVYGPDGVLRYTVRDIAAWAGKMVVEDDYIKVRPYVKFDRERVDAL